MSIVLSFVLGVALLGCGQPSPSVKQDAVGEPAEESSETPIEHESPKGSEAVIDKATATSDSPKTDEDPTQTDNQSLSRLKEPNVVALPKTGSWTVQRLIVLAVQGPIVIDLNSQIDSKDLLSSLRSSVRDVSEKVLSDLGQSASWEKAIQHPLIRSGWLGPLVTQDEQVSRVVQHYDQNRDGTAQIEEMVEFVCLGAMRQEPFTFREDDAPSAENSESPWGPLDRNQDHLLDSQEVGSAAESLLSLDYDGDSSVSIAEIRPEMETTSMMPQRRSRSMLPIKTVIFESSRDRTQDQVKTKEIRKSLGSQILQHYTYLDAIQREVWLGCPDRLWNGLDVSGDGRLDASELAEIFSVEASCRVRLQLPTIAERNVDSNRMESRSTGTLVDNTRTNDSASLAQWSVDFSDFAEQAKWSDAGPNLCLQLPGLHLVLTFEDSFNQSLRNILASQLDAGLRNPQIRSAIAAQLQLSESAFELIDINSDEQLGSDELELVIGWLRCRQLYRLQANWTISALPWFQLLDLDMNLRISEWEISHISDCLSEICKHHEQDENRQSNQQSSHGTDALPLFATIRIRRGDERLAIPSGLLADSGNPNNASADWFSAMDTNGDGAISRAEFLGSRNRFQEIDQDKNGFVSRAETPQKD